MESCDKNKELKPLQFGEKLLDNFLQLPFVKSNASIVSEATFFLNRLQDKSFKIAVIGEFSSGKSTFLNAIIGKDYLTHGVKETTATVTMLVNTQNQGAGRITFSNGTQKVLEDYNQLKEVTTTQSSVYQVSHQIDLVELFVPFMDTDIPVVLVDTPGLNGVAAMHRERTIDIVQSVHACIYMLQSRGLSETDKETLRWIAQYQQEIIIIQNFIDDINSSEGDTLEDVLNKQRAILAESIFSEPEHASINYTVCGVSAIKALASKDTSIQRMYNTDTVNLNNADRELLYSESNFEQTMKAIFEFMEHSFQRTQLSTLNSVCKFLDRTFNIVNSSFEIQSVLWEKSDEAQIILRTKQLLENWDARRVEDEKKLDNFITSKMGECRRLVKHYLDDLVKEAQDNVPSVYEKINTPDEWDEFSKKRIMESSIANETKKIKLYIDEFLVKSCENTHNLAIQRIYECSSLTNVSSNQSIKEFYAEIKEGAINKFSLEENAIESEKSMIEKLKSDKNAAERQKLQLAQETQHISNILTQESQKQSRIQNDFNTKLRSLGEKPEATTYYESVTYYEYRGGLGILDALFGPKEKHRREERKDYTAQNKWIEDERIIKNDYNRQKTELSNKLHALEHERDSAQQKLEGLSKSMTDTAYRIQKKSEIVSEMIKSLELHRALAAKEYVNTQKQKLKNSVCNYLSDTFEPALMSNVNDKITQIRANLSQDIRSIYSGIAFSQKENLQQLLKENRTDDGIKQENLKQDMNSILKLKNELEDYLCNK